MKNFIRLVFLSIALCLASTGFALPHTQQGPTRTQIEDAIRQQKVIVGMDRQDVARAWGRPARGRGIEADEEGEYEVWFYARARVYFFNDKVKVVRLVR
jgi:hypothetical protein